jgi:hypothetical protein
VIIENSYELRVIDFGNAIGLDDVKYYAESFEIQSLLYRAPEVGNIFVKIFILFAFIYFIYFEHLIRFYWACLLVMKSICGLSVCMIISHYFIVNPILKFSLDANYL